MKRTSLSAALITEVLERYNHRCALCDINLRRLDIAMRSMPSSWDYLNNVETSTLLAKRVGGCGIYGKRDRFTSAMTNGALLGRHKDRAHALLGRLWGVTLWPGCHFYEIDHIVPVVEGGRNVASNLRLLCRRCHKGVSIDLMRRLRRRPKKGIGRGY